MRVVGFLQQTCFPVPADARALQNREGRQCRNEEDTFKYGACEEWDNEEPAGQLVGERKGLVSFTLLRGALELPPIHGREHHQRGAVGQREDEMPWD